MMRRIAIFLLIFGIGSFILPLFGLQFKLFVAMGQTAQPVIGILMAILGVFLLYAAKVRE